MRADCIITGAVYVPFGMDDNAGWPCDLHQMGEVYIINANLGSGEPPIQIDPQRSKVIQIVGHCWERNGVIVAHVSQCRLNEAANEYIGN